MEKSIEEIYYRYKIEEWNKYTNAWTTIHNSNDFEYSSVLFQMLLKKSSKSVYRLIYVYRVTETKRS